MRFLLSSLVLYVWFLPNQQGLLFSSGRTLSVMLLLSLPLAHFCHDFWSSNASLQLARSVSRSILWWVVL